MSSNHILFIDDWFAGEHISKACQKMTDALARQKKYEKVAAEFNGVRLVGGRQTTAEQLAEQFKRKIKGAKKAYKRSAKHRKRERESKKELKKMKEEAGLLIQKFNAMDKTDLNKLVAWIALFQPYSDHIGAVNQKRKTQIAKTLMSCGYIRGENTCGEYDGEDKNNSGRYIVGQAISQLASRAAVHPMIKTFANKWQVKFAA